MGRRDRFTMWLAMACIVAAGCARSDTAESRAWRQNQARKQLDKATGRSQAAIPPSSAVAASRPSEAPATRRPPMTGDAARSAARGGRRVLVIDDVTITVDDILKPLRRRLEEASRSKPQAEYYRMLAEEIRDEIIHEVAQHLVWREASRDLDDQKNKAIDNAVQEWERRRINLEFDGRVARYEASLAQIGMSREQAREKMRRAIVVREYVRQRISPQVVVHRDDARRYYDSHYAEFHKPGKLEMWHIDIPYGAILSPGDLRDPGKLDLARKVARERLSAAHEKLMRGEPFEKVCREFSRSRDVETGGRFGVVTAPLAGYWEAPSRRLLTMRGGEISPVFETDFGVFILKAVEVSPGKTISFESAKAAIQEKVRELKTRELEGKYLQSLADRAALGDLQSFVEAVISAAPEWRGAPSPPVAARPQ